MKRLVGKFAAGIMTAAMVISSMAITVMAEGETTAATAETTAAAADTGAAANSVEVALYLKESYGDWSFGDIEASEWSEPVSDSLVIQSDGTYTFTLKDINIPADNLCLCYLKDVAVYGETATASNVPADIVITTDSVKANGRDLEVADGVRTGLFDGVFDVAYTNDWTETDCVVDFNQITENITSIEVTITVSGLGGDPVTLSTDPTVEAETTAAETTAEVAATTAASDSSSDDDSDSSNGTVIAVIVVVAVVAVAGVVTVIARKKK